MSKQVQKVEVRRELKKQIKIKGQNVAYLDFGHTDDPVVLLIHGVPESSMLWKDIIPAIVSEGYRTIAPDLPGFGQSERFNETSSWERYEQFVTDFLNELQLEQVHIVLHDWGGLIGLRWASSNTERVNSLIITDTTFTPDYTWHKAAQIWQTPGKGEELIKQMSNKGLWFAGMKKEVPGVGEDVLEDFFQIFSSDNTRSAILELYRSGDMKKVIPYQGKLKQINKPVTIIWGEKDPYVSTDYAYKLRDQEFPHAKVHIIPDAGHFIHIEVPEATQTFVKEHFNKV
ncbi:alpha/beta fold hydrolase [Alkalihalobacterium chitinilyticum]|uniref:Alpha/beta hydrolase n=1 Tax=Alkalihalobacterium chitinilyticum TaxID=2980103 RepID=A0ABT5VGB1_9BACI|nr:alpha/beta hydrolase [Alkalihalobacterium chitinilyticum]MDE5414499.1 alpha/beta hydrolase [Alkalihalobacterium chitinilyticum]